MNGCVRSYWCPGGFHGREMHSKADFLQHWVGYMRLVLCLYYHYPQLTKTLNLPAHQVRVFNPSPSAAQVEAGFFVKALGTLSDSIEVAWQRELRQRSRKVSEAVYAVVLTPCPSRLNPPPTHTHTTSLPLTLGPHQGH